MVSFRLRAGKYDISTDFDDVDGYVKVPAAIGAVSMNSIIARSREVIELKR